MRLCLHYWLFITVKKKQLVPHQLLILDSLFLNISHYSKKQTLSRVHKPHFQFSNVTILVQTRSNRASLWDTTKRPKSLRFASYSRNSQICA